MARTVTVYYDGDDASGWAECRSDDGRAFDVEVSHLPEEIQDALGVRKSEDDG